MPIPLTVAAPAAAAGLAYLNAKAALWYDYTLVRGALPASIKNMYRRKFDCVNLYYKLEGYAQKKATAERVFLMFEDRTWTYGEAYEMANRYGTWLKSKYNVKRGEVVALDMMNSDHYVLLTFGLWSIGAKPAYINYNLTGKPLAHCVRAAGTTLMLVGPEVLDKIDNDTREAFSNLRVEVMTPELMAEVSATDATRPPDELRAGEQPPEMAVLIYTSGTTGLPKPAIVSWMKLCMAGVFIAGWLKTRTTDIFYTCMPIYHSSATIMGYTHILEAGATFAIGKKFSTKTFWKEARAYNATMVQYVGETCRYLLAAPPEKDPATGENLDKNHKIRLAFGNGLRPDVWEKFRERFGIEVVAEFYGATEGIFVTLNATRNDYTAGAIGRAGWLFSMIMKQRLAIVDVDHDTDLPVRDPKTGLGRQVPRGEPGELMFVIPNETKERFQGYYNDEAATQSKILRDVLKKGDLYFRTGDLVSWDKEGRMYFHDRMGDTFRWKSENVATTEVSQMLGEHPAVQEANVYGVQLPHHDGRAGCAAVVLREAPSATLMTALAAHARNTLPKYAVPLFLRVVPDFAAQTTGTNKQQKHGLRAQGVDPAKVDNDGLWWLKGDTYVEFTQKDWDRLNAGNVKL